MYNLITWGRGVGLLLLTGLFTACGGGGDKAEAEPQSIDLSQLASSQISREDINCLPKIPTWNSFNNYAYEQTQLPPLLNTTVVLSESEGVGGGSTVEIPIIEQNEESLRTMSDLIMNVKDFGSDRENSDAYRGFYPYPSDNDRPKMKYAANKEAYQYIRTRCRSVECVADSVFGESWGARFYFKENYGLSISGVISPMSEEFRNSNSVRAVILAISSLPDQTFPVSLDRFAPGYEIFAENIVIYPYIEGQTMPGGEGAAAVMMSNFRGTRLTNADIAMFDAWKDYPDMFEQAFTVFHELIHLLDTTAIKDVVISKSKEWLNLSDWIFDETSQQWYANNKVMCSTYGRTNPAEDFAECGVLYRYAPDVLKKISKKKYDYFKNKVFKGVEYTSDKACAKSTVKFPF